MANDKTFRIFLLGAGFSKPAGLPLAAELLPLLERAARDYMSVDGYNHLSDAVRRSESYLADTDPSRPFDFEEFGAWLDWEHVLRLKGSDTFSEHGNEPARQLRWAIGHVLHAAMPLDLPRAYIDFARQLNASDMVLTLNYDLLMERALEEVGLPYRRFPHRYSEVYEMYSEVDNDQPDELVLYKLHGSVDWTYFTGRETDAVLQLAPIIEGRRRPDDPLLRVRKEITVPLRITGLWFRGRGGRPAYAVICFRALRIAVVPRDQLDRYYSSRQSWAANPTLIMNPSTAKPMGTSPLIPLWEGWGRDDAAMLGGFTVIGCSLPPGNPYVLLVAHRIGTAYGSGRGQVGALWPQGRMKVVDLRRGRIATHESRERYRFMDTDHTDFLLDGFSSDTVEQIFGLDGVILPTELRSISGCAPTSC